MRQNKQSIDDEKFCNALSNLHYRACTQEDIEFFNSCIANTYQAENDISSPYFHNAAIITSEHVIKDEIDRSGAI
jgi:hypothetical protein